MKKTLLLTTALVLGPFTMAQAGGLPEPEMSPEVVEQATSSSSAGIIVPLLLIVLIAAAAAGGSSGGGGGGVAVSDIRLKEDIIRVGTTHLGLPLYQWRYKGLPEVFEGVMAQDVEIMHPKAIRPLPWGFKAVDYAALGLTLRQVH